MQRLQRLAYIASVKTTHADAPHAKTANAITRNLPLTSSIFASIVVTSLQPDFIHHKRIICVAGKADTASKATQVLFPERARMAESTMATGSRDIGIYRHPHSTMIDIVNRLLTDWLSPGSPRALRSRGIRNRTGVANLVELSMISADMKL